MDIYFSIIQMFSIQIVALFSDQHLITRLVLKRWSEYLSKLSPAFKYQTIWRSEHF